MLSGASNSSDNSNKTTETLARMRTKLAAFHAFKRLGSPVGSVCLETQKRQAKHNQQFWMKLILCAAGIGITAVGIGAFCFSWQVLGLALMFLGGGVTGFIFCLKPSKPSSDLKAFVKDPGNTIIQVKIADLQKGQSLLGPQPGENLSQARAGIEGAAFSQPASLVMFKGVNYRVQHTIELEDSPCPVLGSKVESTVEQPKKSLLFKPH